MAIDQLKRDKEEWQYDWDDHENAQLQSWLKSTHAQRLAWLEDAIKLAHISGALKNRPD